METDLLTLEIISRKKTEKISVLWVEVQSPSGDFVVGPGHYPLVSLLKDRGKITYKEYQGGEKSIDTYGGIFTVDGDVATIVLE